MLWGFGGRLRCNDVVVDVVASRTEGSELKGVHPDHVMYKFEGKTVGEKQRPIDRSSHELSFSIYCDCNVFPGGWTRQRVLVNGYYLCSRCRCKWRR